MATTSTLDEIAAGDPNVRIESNGDVHMRLRSSESAKRAWRRCALRYAAGMLRAEKKKFVHFERFSKDMGNSFEVSAVTLERLAKDFDSPQPSDSSSQSPDDDTVVVEERMGESLDDTLRLLHRLIYET